MKAPHPADKARPSNGAREPDAMARTRRRCTYRSGTSCRIPRSDRGRRRARHTCPHREFAPRGKRTGRPRSSRPRCTSARTRRSVGCSTRDQRTPRRNGSARQGTGPFCTHRRCKPRPFRIRDRTRRNLSGRFACRHRCRRTGFGRRSTRTSPRCRRRHPNKRCRTRRSAGWSSQARGSRPRTLRWAAGKRCRHRRRARLRPRCCWSPTLPPRRHHPARSQVT